MKLITLLLPLLARLALAQNPGLPVSGPFKSGVGDTPEALRISEVAGRQPNASASITFTRLFNNTPETWRWHVNVTDIAVPNRISDLGTPGANFSQALHVTNTQWQLDWPGDDDTFQLFLGERRVNATFTALITFVSSKIKTNNNGNTNGNCTAFLGEQCTQALLQAASKSSQIPLLHLEGCKNSSAFGEGTHDSVSFNLQPNLNRSIPGDLNIPMLYRGYTLFYRTSATHAADDIDAFNRDKTALQLLILNFEHDSDSRGSSSGPTVLCQVVESVSAALPLSWRLPVGVLWIGTTLSTLHIMLAW